MEALTINHIASGISEFVTVSMGAATVRPDSEMSPANLTERADEALYQTKTARLTDLLQ